MYQERSSTCCLMWKTFQERKLRLGDRSYVTRNATKLSVYYLKLNYLSFTCLNNLILSQFFRGCQLD